MIGIVAAAVGGAILGSFGNVVVHRVPLRESIVRPGSRCPSCGTSLGAVDNVPIVSWFVLRGRCRHCKARISPRYPLVEAVTAVLFALGAARIEPATDLIAYLPLFWVLVVLSAIDIDHKLLPNRIVLPSIVAMAALLGVAATLGPGLEAWLRALAGGALGFAGLLVIALIAPKGMGMGDVKLAAVLGMGLGYLGWGRIFVGFFLSFLAGSVGGILLILARRGGMKSEIPFGPYLALGTVLAVLWGAELSRAWLGD